MQFLILAYDGTDEGAPARRMQAREAHLATIAQYKAKGHMIVGAALLNDAGKMNGSAIMADFPDRKALDGWLQKDPYVVSKVWERVQVIDCKLAPSFLHLLAGAA